MVFLRTPACLALLEEALATHCGDMKTACKSVNASPRDVYMWCSADAEVAGRIRAAQQMGWAGLESAAYERAVNGVEKAVYYKGEVVGFETEYSDSLLSLMLKSRVPEYGGEERRGSGVTVNVAVMPRASSYEEWSIQRDKELRALPEPPKMLPVSIEGEWEEVEGRWDEAVLKDVL